MTLLFLCIRITSKCSHWRCVAVVSVCQKARIFTLRNVLLKLKNTTVYMHSQIEWKYFQLMQLVFGSSLKIFLSTNLFLVDSKIVQSSYFVLFASKSSYRAGIEFSAKKSHDLPVFQKILKKYQSFQIWYLPSNRANLLLLLIISFYSFIFIIHQRYTRQFLVHHFSSGG